MGQRLDEMIFNEKQKYPSINEQVKDPEYQKELLIQDEEEDYLDDGVINLRF